MSRLGAVAVLGALLTASGCEAGERPPRPEPSTSTGASSPTSSSGPRLIMETLAAALPQEGDIPGTYFSVECRRLQEPCADLWGVGVVVSEDPASTSTKGGRIAIYPEAGTGSSVPPAEAGDITGWQTVSCVRDFVTYVAAPRSTVTDPEYVDTGTRQEASTAALGKTETGEDIIVIVTAGNPEALKDLQDRFFERLEEEAG